MGGGREAARLEGLADGTTPEGPFAASSADKGCAQVVDLGLVMAG